MSRTRCCVLAVHAVKFSKSSVDINLIVNSSKINLEFDSYGREEEEEEVQKEKMLSVEGGKVYLSWSIKLNIYILLAKMRGWKNLNSNYG